jgi:hypothetical protein
MATLFVNFGAKSLVHGQIFVYNFNGNPNALQDNKLFFPNLYKLYNLCILMNFHLVILRGICPRSSWPQGCCEKCHLLIFSPGLICFMCNFFVSISVSFQVQADALPFTTPKILLVFPLNWCVPKLMCTTLKNILTKNVVISNSICFTSLLSVHSNLPLILSLLILEGAYGPRLEGILYFKIGCSGRMSSTYIASKSVPMCREVTSYMLF